MNNEQLPRKTPRAILRWSILGVFVTSLLIIGWLWRSLSKPLEIKLQSMKANGIPTSSPELNTYYDLPADSTNETRAWVSAIDSLLNAAEALPSPLRKFAEFPDPPPLPQKLWPEYEVHFQVINALDDELQRIRVTATRPGLVRYPIDCTAGVLAMSSFTSKIRKVAHLLVLDANVSAHQGQPSRILDDIKSIDALSDTLQRGPMIVVLMVRFATYSMATREIEKWLAYCEWSDTELESIQAAILSADFEEEAVRCLNGERAYGLTEYRKITLGPFRPSTELEFVNLIQDSIDSFSAPWLEPWNRVGKIESQLILQDQQPVSSLRYYKLSPIGGALEQFTDMVARGVTKQRCACLLIAAQRFRLRHGQLPMSLNEIESELLGPGAGKREIRTDPFNGLSIRFLSDADGISIYSVGKDLIDNEGETAPFAEKIRDVGFKLLRKKMVYEPTPQ